MRILASDVSAKLVKLAIAACCAVFVFSSDTFAQSVSAYCDPAEVDERLEECELRMIAKNCPRGLAHCMKKQDKACRKHIEKKVKGAKCPQKPKATLGSGGGSGEPTRAQRRQRTQTGTNASETRIYRSRRTWVEYKHIGGGGGCSNKGGICDQPMTQIMK